MSKMDRRQLRLVVYHKNRLGEHFIFGQVGTGKRSYMTTLQYLGRRPSKEYIDKMMRFWEGQIGQYYRTHPDAGSAFNPIRNPNQKHCTYGKAACPFGQRCEGCEYNQTTGSSGLFQKFHGANPTIRPIEFNPPKGKKLIKIGRIVSVIYEPEPPSQLAGKQYEHKWGDTGGEMLKHKPILCTDISGKNFFIVNDKSHATFGSRGIVG